MIRLYNEDHTLATVSDAHKPTRHIMPSEKIENGISAHIPGNISGADKDSHAPDPKFEKLGIHYKNGIQFVRPTDIIRCEAVINYTKIFLTSGDVITCAKTLLSFEKILVHKNFFRIHKSHLINLSFIEGFTKGDRSYVIMSDKSNLMVSRRNKTRLLKMLGQQDEVQH
jgi:DNA-binding LytR/AlgR family response regulator